MGEEVKREVGARERARLAKEGAALPDGSFPIANEKDLRNAIQAIGRAKDAAEARRHIRKRARALGLTRLLPKDWKDVDMGEENKALSLLERYNLVQAAFGRLFPHDYDEVRPVNAPPLPWLQDVYEAYAIVRQGEDYYQASYTLGEDGVEFAPQAEWQRVEKEWVAKSREQGIGNREQGIGDREQGTETVVAYGDGLKALGNGRVGGYLVRFSSDRSPDLEGDFFTAETDFGAHEKSLTFYHHGLDVKLGRRVLDPAATMKKDEAGVWVEAQLQLRDEYEKAVYGLATQGKLGWSSGTASHLVEREAVGKAMWIKRWPLGLDASLTPTPAEPRNSVMTLKALKPTPLSLDAEEGSRRGASPRLEVTPQEDAMSEDVKAVASRLDQFEAKMTEFGAAVNQVLQFMQDSPPVRKAGYYSEDGGRGDKRVKSFGDFLLAVRRGDMTRLKAVYATGPANYDDDELKDMTVGVGTQGGVLVPQDYRPELFQVSTADNQIVSKVERIPVSLESGDYPSLDVFTAPTAGAGNSAMAGQITATATAEGGSLTETQARFSPLAWKVRKVGGFVEVTNELIQSSPQSIESLLKALFRIAIAAKTEYYILRGSGVGEPLGILNAPCAVGVTPNTDNAFKYVDSLAMLAKWKPVSGAATKYAWIIHPSMWEDIGVFEVSAGSGGVWNSNMQAQAIGALPLHGYPILVSEHLPQANSAGAALLVDLGAYLLFDREQLAIAFSEHAAFTSDKGTWRFTSRMDGMPWLKNSITLGGPGSAYTVSPFVYHND